MPIPPPTPRPRRGRVKRLFHIRPLATSRRADHVAAQSARTRIKLQRTARGRVGGVRGALRWLRDAIDFLAASSPSRFAVGIFTLMIAAFTVVLTLPISSADGRFTPFVDALFTAVSAICVTGLATVDMATHWSPFGNGMILLALQIGAVGVLTLASMLGLIVSRRLGLRQRLMAASDSNPLRTHKGPVSESQAIRLGDIGGMLTTVVITLLTVELIMTIVFVPRLLIHGNDFWLALYQGFYYAASSFTNTGFTPNPEGLTPFIGDVWMTTAIGFSVLIGSLGFPVIFALARKWKNRRMRLNVHVKLTLVTTAALFVAGTIAYSIFEWSNPNTLGGMDPIQRPFAAMFMETMARSGGFTIVDYAQLKPETYLMTDMLMFVGGGSASTAGGIKVTTLAVLFLAAIAEARGDDDMQVFERRIPNDVLRVAVSIVLWGSTIVVLASMALIAITGDPLNTVIFDVISAFATCGLSNGLTATLPDAGKFVLIATMWAGRVGTVTLAAGLASSQRKQLFKFAEERVIVG